MYHKNGILEVLHNIGVNKMIETPITASELLDLAGVLTDEMGEDMFCIVDATTKKVENQARLGNTLVKVNIHSLLEDCFNYTGYESYYNADDMLLIEKVYLSKIAKAFPDSLITIEGKHIFISWKK